MKKILCILGIVIGVVATKVIQVDAQSLKATTGVFALTGAKIVTVTMGTINNGTIIIKDGKISALGQNLVVPSDAQTIDCIGKTIYPGLIDSSTNLGLLEIGQIPQASDRVEVGDINPQMKALTAVNPNSVAIPITRISGVTTVLTSPEGGLVPGTAALVNLHGYTPDQMYAGFEGVVFNFPTTTRNGRNDLRSEEEIKKKAEDKIKILTDLWEKALQYHKLDSASKGVGLSYYPEMQAMLPVVRGTMPLLIEVNAQKDIQAALKFVKEKKIKNVVFTGVAEGWREAKNIAEANIPVLAGPVIAIPYRDYDRYDAVYANPGKMKKAGVKVALCSDRESHGNYRNLPYHAGFAVTYGMDKEDALKAITIVPAQIFGVSDRLGSIEVGKSATLFVCDGDIFETKTKVSEVFIDGWRMPMQSRQTLLYDEFLNRQPGLNKN